MQSNPHDDSTRWLVTLFVSLFAGGVGWLVKHLAGRRSSFVQLGLQRAQAAEMRAKIRRENESAEFARMRELSDAAWVTADRLRQARDAETARADAAEERIAQLLEEQKERHRMANELHDLKIRWALLDAGVPFADVQKRDIPRIYPEAEGGGCF